MEKPVLEALLIHCQWSHDRLLQQYLHNSAVLMKEAGLAGTDAAETPSPGAQVTCPVCLKSVGIAETTWLWCNHACCQVLPIATTTLSWCEVYHITSCAGRSI